GWRVLKVGAPQRAPFLLTQAQNPLRATQSGAAHQQPLRAVQLHFESEPGARKLPSYSMILKRFRDSSLTVRPSPGVFSSRSMYPSVGTGSPSKIYQNSSLPTSTS